MEDFLTSFFVAPFTGLATGIASATSPLDVIDAVDGFVWGPIMILLLLFTHIFMTVRTGFIQRKLGTGIKMSVTKDDPSDASGDITQFGALTTALAATIGTGNIVGVGGVVLGDGQLDAGADLALDEPGADGHEDVRAKQQQNHDRAPHEAIDGIDDVERAGSGGDSLRKSGERRDEERCKEILHGLPLFSLGRAHAFGRTERGRNLPNAYPFLAYMTGKTLPKAVYGIVSIWKTNALRH